MKEIIITMISVESGVVWEFMEGFPEEVVFELKPKSTSELTKRSVIV